MAEHEQRHIVSAFSFELSKVETVAIRERMVGHLLQIHPDLAAQVIANLGMKSPPPPAKPAVKPRDLPPSPALSLAHRAGTFAGRKLGLLVTDGADAKLVAELTRAVEKEKAMVQVVALKIGGVTLSDGSELAADHALAGAPSCLFDAVAIIASEEGTAKLLTEAAAAVDWARDAFGHLKALGHSTQVEPLLDKAAIDVDEGVIDLGASGAVARLIKVARQHRVWAREVSVRS